MGSEKFIMDQSGLVDYDERFMKIVNESMYPAHLFWLDVATPNK
jgi:hypothetical protein